MDAATSRELNSIINELNSIISELNSISSGVRNDFKNIGNDRCAKCIDKVSSQYVTVRTKLNRIDTTKVTSSYAASHGGGSGRH